MKKGRGYGPEVAKLVTQEYFKDDAATFPQIALRFGVSETYVRKTVHLSMMQEEFDAEEAARSANHVKKRKLTDGVLQYIRALVLCEPDIYIREIQQNVFSLMDLWLSQPTICRALQTLHLSRKVANHVHACRQRPDIMQWKAEFLRIRYEWTDFSKVFFFDESGVAIENGQRRYGRNYPGLPVNLEVAVTRGKRWSVLALLGLQGISCKYVFEGTVCSGTLLYYFEHAVSSTVPPGSVIVLDNAKTHWSSELLILCELLDLKLVFLPPYHPDLNPIELAWGYMKARLEGWRGQDMEVRGVEIICAALDSITPAHARAWMKHDGYSV